MRPRSAVSPSGTDLPVPFVHLHTHSEYSLLDGHAKIEKLLDRADELGMPAMGLTDHGVMFGAVEFYKAATQPDPKWTSRGAIKPIIGCEVYFTPGARRLREGKPELYHLLLLAKDMAGYRNLMALASEAATKGYYYKPRVDEELLRECSEGLIGTSACMSGAVSKSIEMGSPEQARAWAELYASIFAEGDFYLEIQNQGIVADNGVTQDEITAEIARIGSELGLPLVATNDVHYVEASHASAQDMLVCIQTQRTVDDPDRMRFSSDQFYVKSLDEMREALPAYPEALENTLRIAERCDLELEFGRIILPVFEVPAGRTEAEHLRDECMRGMVRRYGERIPDEALARLELELEVITGKGLSAYFLIVADFVGWAKGEGIGVGPGRGSAAGSIISYALGITDLDPLEHGLLFERFLNPERTEMPDIDIDFDDEGRDRVIGYVRDKYGDDRVAQVVTFSTMLARAAIRDAGRVLGYPYGVPDRVAKQISESTIAESVKKNPELRDAYASDEDTKRIIDAARELEGVVRGEGVHAAAVVICRDPLHEHTPVKLDTKGGAIVTQYEGSVVAELGLLKMDFLGLRTLTVISRAVAAIRESRGIDLDMDTLPWDDPDTFALLQRADTDGVFQLESPGMKRVLRDLQPTAFADIVAVVALYRPGPMDYIPDYVDRKRGRKSVTYYDDRLKPILEETYGRMVYQEQVMRISMEMSGFTAARADKLRKAMGKKDSDLIAEQARDFIEGATANGYDRKMVQELWKDIESFAKYAFNKSHAAAYAVLAYKTAYLKAHWPQEYMAAVLTSYAGKTDEIVRYIAACGRAGIEVLPPDVNSSGKDFTAVGEAVRFGLAGIRNVGEGVVEHVVEERRAKGPFTSLHDFCARVDLTRCNRKTVESLVKAGAFDTTGYTRRHLLAMMDEVVEAALKRQREVADGQTSLFEDLADVDHGFATAVPPPDGVEWDKRMKLAYEKEMLGIYVSDHPLSDVAPLIESARSISLGDSESARDGTTGWVAGIVTRYERRPTKSGKMMATLTIEDLDGSMDAVIFPQHYERFRELFEVPAAPAEDGSFGMVDPIVRMKVRVESSDRDRKLLVQEVEPLSADGFVAPPRQLKVATDEAALHNGRSRELKEILARFPGSDEVRVELTGDSGTKLLRLPERVDAAADGLHAAIKGLLGPGTVSDI